MTTFLLIMYGLHLLSSSFLIFHMKKTIEMHEHYKRMQDKAIEKYNELLTVGFTFKDERAQAAYVTKWCNDLTALYTAEHARFIAKYGKKKKVSQKLDKEVERFIKVNSKS